MRFAHVILTSLLLLGCASTATEEAAPAEQPSPEELMEIMMGLGQPAEAHAELVRTAGTWDVDMQSWMDPDGEPMQMKATVVRTPIFGNRFVREDFRSDFMGHPFEGMLLLGHDNFTEEYFAIWLDSFSSSIAVLRGKKDATGAVHMSGTLKDPVTPDGRPYRSVTRTPSPDRIEFEMFDTKPDGTEFRMMSSTYTRR